MVLVAADAAVTMCEQRGWQDGDEWVSAGAAVISVANWGLACTPPAAEGALAELDTRLENAEDVTAREDAYQSTGRSVLRLLGSKDPMLLTDEVHVLHLRRTLHAIAASM